MWAGRIDPRFGLVLARRVTSRSRIRPNPSDKPGRLQAVQNVLASVVDIGAKTDYNASDPDVELKRACCHGGPTRVASTSERSFSILEHSINVILN